MKKIFVGLLFGICVLFPNMKVSASEKVQVYIFRGEGCPHCEDALEFFDSLSKEEKAKFDVHEYEVWNNSKNKDLMSKVVSKLGETTSSVPYIVIGEKSFVGFDESIGESLLEEIDAMYESKQFVDVVSEFTKRTSSDMFVVIGFIVCLIAFVSFIIIARRKM